MADRAPPRELCDHLRPWLERYADGELHDARRKRLVRAHLDACPRCRARLRRLDELIADVLRTGGFDPDDSGWRPTSGAFGADAPAGSPRDEVRVRAILDAVAAEPAAGPRAEARRWPPTARARRFAPWLRRAAAAALVVATVLAAEVGFERSAVAPGEPGAVAFVAQGGQVRPVRLEGGDAVEGERRVFLRADRGRSTDFAALRWVLDRDVPADWAAALDVSRERRADGGRVWLLGVEDGAEGSSTDAVFELGLEVLVDDGGSRGGRGAARVLVLPEEGGAASALVVRRSRPVRLAPVAGGRAFRAVAAQVLEFADRRPVPRDLVRPLPRYRIIPVRGSSVEAPAGFPVSPSSLAPSAWPGGPVSTRAEDRARALLLDPARLGVGPRS